MIEPGCNRVGETGDISGDVRGNPTASAGAADETLTHTPSASRECKYRLLPGAVYLVRASGDAAILALSITTVRDTRHAGLPLEDVVDYHLIAGEDMEICIPGNAEIKHVARGISAFLWRTWINARSIARVVFSDALLTAYPASNDRKALKAFNRSLRVLRTLDLEPGRCFSSSLSFMVYGCRSNPKLFSRADVIPTGPRVAVVLHLHYLDLWPEFAVRLESLNRVFTLFVTLTSENHVVQADISSRFPGAQVSVVPNFGRDIGPFLGLLEGGVFEGFDVVCKLHGKKSLRHGKATMLGESWRRRSILELLGDSAQFDKILAMFDDDPHLGMLGSEAFRLPNNQFPAQDAWGANRDIMRQLAGRLAGSDKVPVNLDFFAGTMFWFRPAALRNFRGTGLHHVDTFAAEEGRTDGSVEHALERLLPHAVRCGGFRLANVPAAF